MSIFGIDYSFGKPNLVSLPGAGVHFICRYLSPSSGKNLTRTEADAASGLGVSIVVVWESTASRALAGHAAGAADATRAAEQAHTCGMPDDRPVYFAVDWDATAGQQAAVNAYLDGAASVLGRDRVGLYAGYSVIKRAFDSGKITWGWQTYAWSGGQWDKRAHIQQYENGKSLAGGTVDYDRAMYDDYGQWKVGESPVALSDADKKWMLANLPPATWKVDNVVQASDDNTENPFWGPNYHLYDIGRRLRAVQTSLAAVASAGGDLSESEIIAGVLEGLSPETLANAIATHLSPDVAGKVLDGLRSRLES